MKIIWKQWEIAPDDHQFGHGILFFDTCKPRGNNLVAWVEGYEWLHRNPSAITAWQIAPDLITTNEILAEMRRAIEEHLMSKSVPKNMLTSRIEAWPNA